MKSLVLNSLLLGGYGATCAGLYQWYAPAAWIFGGVLAMAAAVLSRWLDRPTQVSENN